MSALSADVFRVIGENPSDYTLDGTNTWIIGAPGCDDAILIDPGPDHHLHLAAVEAQLDDRDMALGTVILTHAHDDHLGNLWRIVARNPQVQVHSMLSGYPDTVATGGTTLEVLRTPGHTHDSVCLWNRDAGLLFTGDMVLGDGPTMIDYPDASLTDYLDSLERLIELPGLTALYPGHGRLRTDPYVALEWNLAHRRRRLDDVAQAAKLVGWDAERITSHCYPNVSAELRVAALQNTLAALDHLDPSRSVDAATGPSAPTTGEA